MQLAEVLGVCHIHLFNLTFKPQSLNSSWKKAKFIQWGVIYVEVHRKEKERKKLNHICFSVNV